MTEDGPALALVLALASTAGCAPDHGIFLASPHVDGASTTVLYVASSGQTFAQPARDTIQIRARGERVELELSIYREPLVDLGLDAGEVSARSCRPCDLVAPLASFTGQISDGEASWELRDAPSDALLAAVLPDRPRCETCAELTSRSLPHPELDINTKAIALPVDGQRALVLSMGRGAAYWVSRLGGVVAACQGGGPTLIRAAYAAGPHTIWTGDASGRMAQWAVDLLDPRQPCEAATTTRTPSAPEPIVRLSGAPEGAPTEIFGMSEGRQLYRYTAAGWERVGRPLPGSDGWMVGWLGPRRGVGANAELEVVWYRDGVAENAPVLVEGKPTYVTGGWLLPFHGVVIGTRFNLLLFESGSGFRVARQPPVTSDGVRGLAAVGRSIFITSSSGGVRELHPRLGYCDSIRLFGDHAPRDVVALDDGALIVAPSEVWIAEPTRPDLCRP